MGELHDFVRAGPFLDSESVNFSDLRIIEAYRRSEVLLYRNIIQF